MARVLTVQLTAELFPGFMLLVLDGSLTMTVRLLRSGPRLPHPLPRVLGDGVKPSGVRGLLFLTGIFLTA